MNEATSDLENRVVGLLQQSGLFQSVEVVERASYSQEQYTFKIRARIKHNLQFQVRMYYNRGHIDYAYQLFSNRPLLRWDNAEHYPDLENAPHHFHDNKDVVSSSELSTDPLRNTEIVLEELYRFLSQSASESGQQR